MSLSARYVLACLAPPTPSERTVNYCQIGVWRRQTGFIHYHNYVPVSVVRTVVRVLAWPLYVPCFFPFAYFLRLYFINYTCLCFSYVSTISTCLHAYYRPYHHSLEIFSVLKNIVPLFSFRMICSVLLLLACSLASSKLVH